MAWEQRGRQTYYYRSMRRHGRVTKAYLGTGPLAALSAAEDTDRQAQRQAEAQGLAAAAYGDGDDVARVLEHQPLQELVAVVDLSAAESW